MNINPCTNKTMHAPLMTRFVPLHMQDSGQHSSIQTQAIVFRTKICKNYTNSEIEKMKGQATLSEKLRDFDL